MTGLHIFVIVVFVLLGRKRYPSGNFSTAVLIFSDSVFSMRSGVWGCTNTTTEVKKRNPKKASEWLPW